VIQQKLEYHAKYLKISWTYVHPLYPFGRPICGNDYTDIDLAVAQQTLLWQPVKFRHSGVLNGLEDIMQF